MENIQKMKKIEAIIRPEKLIEIKDALGEAGYPAITTYDVRGTGKQAGLTMRSFDGTEVKVDLLPKQKIDLFINDEDLDKILEIIIEKGKTGNIGDGKIFISSCDEAVTVRTGERVKKL